MPPKKNKFQEDPEVKDLKTEKKLIMVMHKALKEFLALGYNEDKILFMVSELMKIPSHDQLISSIVNTI